jgi:membrane protease YdiL (CAAX protease family)
MSGSRQRTADLLVLVAMVFPTLAAWFYFVHLDGQDSARWAYLGAKGVQLALPLLWVMLTAGAAAPREHRRGLLAGAASGLAIGGSIVGLYFFAVAGTPLAEAIAEQIRSKLVDFRVASPLPYLAMAAALSVVHSLFEEYYWRWFVFGRLRRWLPGGPAAALGSLAFASHHVIIVMRYQPPGGFWTLTVPATAAVALGGVIWCWHFQRSGGLLAPWISHLLVDAALMLVGYLLVWG